MKRISTFLLVLTLISHTLVGQRFYAVAFNELPQDYQLYPRNDNNEATVAINGTIELSNWKYLSVTVLRNKKTYQYQRSNIDYTKNSEVGTFNLKPVIKAELAEYDLQVYASQTGKDSVLMVERKNIVAGDVYMIYGQSNARAWEVDYQYRNEYCRTFGFGSQSAGFTWGLSNDGYTGGYNGEQNIVGEWGIELQRAIVENYGIPSCVINGATSGQNIKTLSDRNPNNPSDYNTLYGRMVDYAQKAKVINNIKGFFYWQAETDAVQNPALWKPGFEQIYKFWKTDFPSIKKFYVFQISLFGAGQYNDEVGVLRDYQRRLPDYFPDVTSYAPLGATGWNGWHFDLAGYTQIGKELGKIVGYDFYNTAKKIRCPSVKKVYYSSPARDEITLAFEDGQAIIYPKDTIAPNIGGGFGTYSLKDFFYLNKEWQRVTSGKAEGNRIVLTLKQKAADNDTLIKYLPSVYPYSGGSFILQEAPWIYIGPFIKNADGMRAFAFHDVKVAPYQSFQPITLSSTTSEGKNVTLAWNKISNITDYVLERLSAKDSNNIQLSIKLSSTLLSYRDTSALAGTNYLYRIKAINSSMESAFSYLSVTTTADFNAPLLTNMETFFNTIKLSITPAFSFKGDSYIIERKKSEETVFKTIAEISSAISLFSDTTVSANTQYTYRVKTAKGLSFSNYSPLLSIKTLALLNTPTLSVNIINNNTLTVSWKAIEAATGYVLERKSATTNFSTIATLTGTATEFSDKTLTENTVYTYRIKAIGVKTESVSVTVQATTPALLSKPDLSVSVVFYNALKINWKTINGASSYSLERKTGIETYQTIATLKPTETEWSDKELKDNTLYTYRIKAFGDKTESLETVATGQTPAKLTTPTLVADNITHESIKLTWKSIPLASKYLLERQNEGETQFQKIVETDNITEYNDTKLSSNQSYIYRLKALSTVSESDFNIITLKTRIILANESEAEPVFSKIYPNPTKSMITVDLRVSTTGSIRLIDFTGKEVFYQNIVKAKQLIINLGSIKIGSYLVIINNNQEIYTHKLIIE